MIITKQMLINKIRQYLNHMVSLQELVDWSEKAEKNLQEEVELFFKCASEQEIKERIHEDIFITRLEVAVG